VFRPKKVIGVLGSQGGGRDVWKREAMGEIAAKHCNSIVLTSEDPYDEDPARIIDGIEKGIWSKQRQHVPSLLKIEDRRQAIRRAIALAQPGDAVVLTGKGGEVWMCVADGRKIPWDERRIVEEELDALQRG
jgi:UDP-N-acetylmuramoyl-L-alanyl-D-glutamate--2,6-diaminopimelate ligase